MVLRSNLGQCLERVLPFAVVEIFLGLRDLCVEVLPGKNLVIEVETDEHGRAIPILGEDDGTIGQVVFDLCVFVPQVGDGTNLGGVHGRFLCLTGELYHNSTFDRNDPGNFSKRGLSDDN